MAASFTSTLSLLALHNNRLKVLSDFHIDNDESRTTILLHNNLLSCCVPTCDNAEVKDEFQPWVLEHEHDSLLWISGTEGMSLVQKISGVAGLLMFVVVAKLGSA